MSAAAASKLREWRERPDIFVREVFGATPDAWQDEILQIFPKHPRIAMKACKGPGKTCLLAWLCWNFLLTRPHPRIAATAVSGENLRDNLWTEMATWLNRSEMLKSLFEWQAERIVSKQYPETWWMSARRWSKSANAEQQGNTLAGLHAPYVMIVLDESGGIPDAVMANAEGIGSSATEWHIVQAGNPTHLEGPLYRACTSERHLWYVVEITSDPDSPKRTSRVSAQWARDQISKYGRDNPWVLVSVFGQFPPSSINSLIGPDDVNRALGAHIREQDYLHSAKTLGVDVGRYGDDPSIIFPRQGMATFTPMILRNVGAGQGAGHVAAAWKNFDADACFIDATGGYGGYWAESLHSLGYRAIEVQYSGKSNDPKYFNKRAEIWFLMCEAIKAGMVLPNIPEIVAELTVPTYSFKGDKLMIEDKDQIKQRLGRSPNYADALATTFAQPVAFARDRLGLKQYGNKVVSDYSPMDRYDNELR